MANAVTDFVATQATKSTTGQGIAGALASVAFMIAQHFGQDATSAAQIAAAVGAAALVLFPQKNDAVSDPKAALAAIAADIARVDELKQAVAAVVAAKPAPAQPIQHGQT